MGKNIGKNVSGRYSQKPFDHAKKSATDALKSFSRIVFQKQQKQLRGWIHR